LKYDLREGVSTDFSCQDRWALIAAGSQLLPLPQYCGRSHQVAT
jgi:hypothetical protein